MLSGGSLGPVLCLVLPGLWSRSSPGWGWGVLLLWGWGHLACTPTWTSRSLNRTAHCPCSTCQQSPHQVFPSSGPLPHPLQMSQTWGPATTAQVPDCTADQPSQLPPQIGEYPSGGGHFPPCNHCVARVSLGHLTLLLNVLFCLHPTCPFRQTDDTPRGTKADLISHPGVQGPLSVLSLSCSLFVSLFLLFFCFLLFFVRFVSFIPSKPPEQLTMSNYSGTLALFTFSSKTEDVG